MLERPCEVESGILALIRVVYMSKILCIGDFHAGRVGYAEYIKDGRYQERVDIKSFIIEKSKDCSAIVFLGDQYNTKNPLAETVKEFTAFLEGFGDKQIILLQGNHELKSDKSSSIDYLSEITNKKWHVVRGIEKIGTDVFCSYQNRQFLEAEDNLAAQRKLMSLLPEGRILFTHQAVSNTLTNGGVNTDIFDEIVLPKKELESKYELSVSGHIHNHSESKKTLIAGSVFTNEISELEKFVWKIDTDTLAYEKIKLPNRPIYKLENPTVEDFKLIPQNSIIKVIFTQVVPVEQIESVRALEGKFDALIVVEHIKKDRKEIYQGKDNLLDMSTERLLEVYAEQRKVDIGKLKHGFGLIKDLVN